jgi:hypothetical protein
MTSSLRETRRLEPRHRSCSQSSSSCKWLIPAVAATICLLAFTPLLWPDDRVIPDDIFCDYASFQLPIREFAREEFLSGRFPLWIPYLGCGTPLHASQQASLCHPILTPLVILLGANKGLKVSLFIALLLTYVGAYWLARDLSISRWSAALVAVVVTWGAFPVMHLMEGHVIIVQEYAVIPWFFVALNRLLSSPTPRRCAFLALTIGWMALCGQPQIQYYTLLFGLLWAAGSWAFGAAAHSRARLAGWGATALVCGCLLGAIQLLPSFELTLDGISKSDRGQASYASQHAINTIDFARMLAPNVMGNPLCELKRFDEVDFVHERIGYLGVLPLLLAIYGLTRRSCARWQWGAAMLVLFGLVIALGNNAPVFELLRRVVPGLTLFRCPGRILSVLTVLIAILAGQGMDAWAKRDANGGFGSMWRLALASAFALMLGVFGSISVFQRYEWHNYLDYARQNLVIEVMSSAVTIFVALIAIVTLPKRLPAKWCCLAALALTMLDLGDQTIGNFSLEPRRQGRWDEQTEFHPLTQPAREAVIRIVENANFLFWPGSLAGTRIVPLVIGAHLPSIITNEGGILPGSLVRLHRAIEKTPSVGLAISGCNYDCSRTGDVWQPLPGALPRIRCVPGSGRELALTAIEDLGTAQVDALRAALVGNVDIVHEDPQLIDLQVTVPQDGLLVVADLFYPGWECHVDGQPATIEAAHGVFRAVEVKTGEHRVVFRYRSASFRIGAWCSLAGLAVVGILAALPKRAPQTQT